MGKAYSGPVPIAEWSKGLPKTAPGLLPLLGFELLLCHDVRKLPVTNGLAAVFPMYSNILRH